MHDKPHPDTSPASVKSTSELIQDLSSVDPADAPDIADTVADRLEAGLAPSPEVSGS